MIAIDPAAPSRILIIRLTALGDVVYALPALSALRKHCPKAWIAWAVEEAAAGLLRGHPQIDELIVVPRKNWQARLKGGRLPQVLAEAWRFRRNLRANGFHFAIELQGNLRGSLIARASGARHKIGFAPPCNRECAHLLLNHAIAVDDKLHKVSRNMALLEAIGVPPCTEGVIPPPGEEGRGRVDEMVSRIDAGGSFVLLHPGVSRFGSFKQWPAEKYVRLCRMLKERGVGVGLSAGPGEEELVRAIAGEAEGAVPVTGLGLLELAELMRKARAFVGADTGPTQMAWMAGTPTVALMGPKDPRLYGPIGAPHRKLIADLPCRPCDRRECADNRCMKEIAAEDVLTAAISIMKGR